MSNTITHSYDQRRDDALQIFDRLICYDQDLQCIIHAQTGGPIKHSDLREMISDVRNFISTQPKEVLDVVKNVLSYILNDEILEATMDTIIGELKWPSLITDK